MQNKGLLVAASLMLFTLLLSGTLANPSSVASGCTKFCWNNALEESGCIQEMQSQMWDCACSKMHDFEPFIKCNQACEEIGDRDGNPFHNKCQMGSREASASTLDRKNRTAPKTLPLFTEGDVLFADLSARVAKAESLDADSEAHASGGKIGSCGPPGVFCRFTMKDGDGKSKGVDTSHAVTLPPSLASIAPGLSSQSLSSPSSPTTLADTTKTEPKTAMPNTTMSRSVLDPNKGTSTFQDAIVTTLKLSPTPEDGAK